MTATLNNKINNNSARNINQLATWGHQDTRWMLGLYGTAIGAGTLFLPIDAGIGGFWPLIIMTLFTFPMVFWSHQALCRFVLSSQKTQSDITIAVDEHFGAKIGRLLKLLYFFSVYPIVLLYSVAITNTTQSFIVHQLHITPPPRAILAFVLISLLFTIINVGQNLVIRALSLLVYPFITILMLLALCLMPHWSTAILQSHLSVVTTPILLIKSLWLIIPVFIFSFNHSPLISSFAVNQKMNDAARAESKCDMILKYSNMLMFGTVMFFVFSCILSLSPTDLAHAKLQNISILSYIANHFHASLIVWVAPILALFAISKSFLGHYMGASEGLRGLINCFMKRHDVKSNKAFLTHSINAFMLFSCWVTATINPSILGIIETLSGPVIALLLFLMPMIAMYQVPAMAKYQNKMKDSFITFIGLIAITAILYKIL